jgi:alkyl hydroperoxide reductase subunit AhpC
MIGQPAPEWSSAAYVKGENKTVSSADYKGKWNKTVSSADYKGKWYLLYFYPLDFTFI